MVFGNTGDRSGTGVGFTRNPATGAKEFYGEFLINAQGEDVVAGIRTPRPIRDLETVMPRSYKQLRQITTRLEKHYKDVQDFEFTIQDDELYMLQTRNGKRTGYAAVVIATDLVSEKLVTPKDALLMVEPESLSQLLSPIFDPAEWKKMPVATKGLPASPGAASGQVVFTADDAVEWTRQGKKAMLVRKETVPDDIHGMFVAVGILTATGGMTSHAAVVGRQMGKPSVVGAGALEISEHAKTVLVGTTTLKEGDWLSFERADGRGEDRPGRDQAERNSAGGEQGDEGREVGHLPALQHAAVVGQDKYRRLEHPGQRRPAGSGGNCLRVRRARGIGLCRTEHMFFAEDRLPIVQRMILADTEKDRRAALDELLPLQRRDFYGVFKAMHGSPVTIRTIDPPLHEFLPKREDLMVDLATMTAKGQKGAEVEAKRRLLHRVEQLHEFNPMLGHRWRPALGSAIRKSRRCRRAPSWKRPASCRKKAARRCPRS